MDSTPEPSAFESIGGEPKLRAIIQDFVSTMTNDMMIGFFFRDVDLVRLVEMEYQFTARFLGADIPYSGKPMREAHAPHPIMGGQFDRRKKILEETLVRHAVPEEIRRAWLLHVDKLRGLITRDSAGQCNPSFAEERIDLKKPDPR